jgi:hypothetical protein
MTKATAEQWQKILSTAARDPAFRDHLVESPQRAANTLGIQLDQADVGGLQKVTPEIKSAGGDPKRSPEDALRWAITVMHHGELGGKK